MKTKLMIALALVVALGFSNATFAKTKKTTKKSTTVVKKKAGKHGHGKRHRKHGKRKH